MQTQCKSWLGVFSYAFRNFGPACHPSHGWMVLFCFSLMIRFTLVIFLVIFLENNLLKHWCVYFTCDGFAEYFCFFHMISWIFFLFFSKIKISWMLPWPNICRSSLVRITKRGTGRLGHPKFYKKVLLYIGHYKNIIWRTRAQICIFEKGITSFFLKVNPALLQVWYFWYQYKWETYMCMHGITHL